MNLGSQWSASGRKWPPPLPGELSRVCRHQRYPDMRRDPSVRRLSPRERQTALLFTDGLKPAVIAHRLNLTPQTVSAYLQRIKVRLNLARQADIAPWVAARRVPDCPDVLRRADNDQLGYVARHQQEGGDQHRHRDSHRQEPPGT